MELIQGQTVGEIVAGNIKTTHVFKKHGIDFCCGGGISIKTACDQNKIDISTLVTELLSVDEKAPEDIDYNLWELDDLVKHIVEVHHSYVMESIPLILQYSDRVREVHGLNHPEVIKINKLFYDASNELVPHMKKEEEMLFSHISKLVEAKKDGLSSVPDSCFGTVTNPIRMMNQEHDGVGEIFRTIADLSSNYTPPVGACNTYQALYSKLQEFEEDLHLHIHLESNILFPKAIELES